MLQHNLLLKQQRCHGWTKVCLGEEAYTEKPGDIDELDLHDGILFLLFLSIEPTVTTRNKAWPGQSPSTYT